MLRGEFVEAACAVHGPGFFAPEFAQSARYWLKEIGAEDADEFYTRIAPRSLTEDQRRVHRQALAGMLWGKQYYYFDLDRWLLLRFRADGLDGLAAGPRTQWLALQRREHPAEWHALRCALYSPAVLPGAPEGP